VSDQTGMPVLRKDRIIIDTNLWVSFLVTPQYSKVDGLMEADQIELIFSQELLEEFVEVARRPKFRKYFSLTDLDDLLTAVQKKAKLVSVFSVIDLCRDPKDNFLLALAKDSKSSHLLTSDKDLLELKSFGKTRIMTMADYLRER